jgi:glutaminase
VNRIALAGIALPIAAAVFASSRPTTAQSPATPQAALQAAYDKYKDLKEGKNADYIPALAKVDPNLYGLALVTPEGKVYSAGDVTSEVSMQSISKVFTMAKVVVEQGLDAIP